MKGREPLLQSASDERTCDGTETRFPLRCPQETENGNANGSPDAAFSTAERRQEGKSEGDGRTLVDPLAFDLDLLAAAISALGPADRERLAALLTGKTG